MGDAEENVEQMRLPPARFGRAMKKGFRDVYDYLGLVVASSLIWSLVWLGLAAGWYALSRAVGVSVGLAVGCSAAALIIVAPLGAGLCRMAYRIVYRDDPSLLDIPDGFRGLLLPSWALAGINAAVTVVLIADAAFFFGAFGPFRGSWVGFALGALCLYLLLVWLMTALYHLPVLAAQRPMGQRRGAVAVIKKSFVLAAHNPGFTIGLFVVTLGLGILCALSVIGMLILYAGAVSIILTHALRELFVRYEIVEESRETVEDMGSKTEYGC